MASASELDRLAREVIGAAIDVHRRIGPGCFETAYTPCFARELTRRGLRYEAGVYMDLEYDDVIVPRAYQIDLLVEDAIVIEIKSAEALARVHMRQVLTYLRLTGCPLGLLLNFGAPLMPEGIKRVANNFPYGTAPVGRRSPLAAT